MVRVSHEETFREQFTEVFGKANYPLDSPFKLIPLLPDGIRTTFESGDIVIPAIDLGMVYGEYQEYPYEAVEELVDDLIQGLKQEDVI